MAGKGPERKAAETLIAATNTFQFNPGLFSACMQDLQTPEGRLNVMRAFYSVMLSECRRYEFGEENDATLFAARALDHLSKFDDYREWL